MNDITIRPYQPKDASALAGVFYASIMAIDAHFYSDAQKKTWAGDSSLKDWEDRFAQTQPWVAVIENQPRLSKDGSVDNPVGFIEFLDSQNHLGAFAKNEAYIDCLYVNPDYQRQGVAGQLYAHAVVVSKSKTIWVHASKVAKPFFIKRGFELVYTEHVWRENVKLERFLLMNTSHFLFNTPLNTNAAINIPINQSF